MNKNQNGFSIVEILIILVLVAVLGFFGWFILHSKQSKDAAHNPTTSDIAPFRYLVIKEWGIKLPLHDPILDAYYVVSTGSQGSDGKPNTVWLGLKSLDSKGCEASQANSGGAYPIGALIKASPTDKDPVSGEPITQADPNGITIEGTYYAYHSGLKGSSPTRCAAKADIANTDSIDKAFVTAIKATLLN